MFQKKSKQTQYLLLSGTGMVLCLLAFLAWNVYGDICRWQQTCMALEKEEDLLQQVPEYAQLTVPEPELLQTLQTCASAAGIQLFSVQTQPGMSATCMAEGMADYHGFIYFLTALESASPLAQVEIRTLMQEGEGLRYTIVLRPVQDNSWER